jgi:hypothetical protein
MAVVVVAAVGAEALRLPWWSADLAAHWRHAVDERNQLGAVVTVAARDRQASGIPVASTRRWCLEPFLALSTGLGPVAEPSFLLAHG